MKLCITEKESVADEISKVIGAVKKTNEFYIGNNFIVSWCLGHLIELCDVADYNAAFKKWDLETLPIIPDNFKYRVKQQKDVQERFNVLRDLMFRDDVEEIIDCGDAGREGCCIQFLVRNFANCTKPVRRLWISSLTQESIHMGFQNLRDIHDFDLLTEAAIARMKKDWVIGINATRAMTKKYATNDVLYCGTAQSPTLNLIVQKANQIEEFQPSEYFTIKVDVANGVFATLKTEDKIDNFSYAKSIEAFLYNKMLVVERIIQKRKKEERPFLYNLTDLQRDANKKFQFSAKKVLDIMQSLYMKKLTTYPRTSSKFITQDMESMFIARLHDIATIPQFENLAVYLENQELNIDNRIINDDGVTDHHAIIVTENIRHFDLKKLTLEERELLHLIIARMFISVNQSHILEETKIIFSCADYCFELSQTETIRDGWRASEKIFFPDKRKKRQKSSIDLSVFEEGEQIEINKILVEQTQTSPPQYYTEDTLLFVMQNIDKTIPDPVLRKKLKGYGIGTEATRADIIEGLVKHGYIKREKKAKITYLLPTEKGKKLVSVLPQELLSCTQSIEWEEQLCEIEAGGLSMEDFTDIVSSYTKDLIQQIKDTDATDITFWADEIVGICPRCQRNVIENRKNGVYSCEGFYDRENKCTFSIWKNNKRYMSRTTTPLKTGQIKLLLEGKTFVANCISKTTGKPYKGIFAMKDKGKNVDVEMIDFAKSHKS